MPSFSTIFWHHKFHNSTGSDATKMYCSSFSEIFCCRGTKKTKGIHKPAIIRVRKCWIHWGILYMRFFMYKPLNFHEIHELSWICEILFVKVEGENNTNEWCLGTCPTTVLSFSTAKWILYISLMWQSGHVANQLFS